MILTVADKERYCKVIAHMTKAELRAECDSCHEQAQRFLDINSAFETEAGLTWDSTPEQAAPFMATLTVLNANIDEYCWRHTACLAELRMSARLEDAVRPKEAKWLRKLYPR